MSEYEITVRTLIGKRKPVNVKPRMSFTALLILINEPKSLEGPKLARWQQLAIAEDYY